MSSTLEYELLEAFAEPDDPVGRLVASAVHAYLDGLMYEAVNDPGVRDALRRAGGFCRRHWWWLTRLGTAAFGATILLEDVLGEQLARLEAGSDALEPAFDADGMWVGRGARCPACEIEAGARERTLAALAEHADDSAWIERYHAGRGIIALDALGALEGTALHAATLAKLRDLLDELAEFKRKHDYRFADEAFGDEGTSWLRAVAALQGLPLDGVKR